MKTPFFRALQNQKSDLLKSIKKFYEENLLAVALFGSSARGDLTTSSDIDLLIILRETPLSLRKRASEFLENVADELIILDYSFPISPIIFTLEELKKNPPLLLDLLISCDIIYDKDNHLSQKLEELKNLIALKKIQKLNFNDKYYWVFNKVS